MKLEKLTISDIHNGLKNKEFSCREITDFYLNRINERNNEINAFITVTGDMAREQAEIVDQRIHEGEELRPLEGVPFALKDNMTLHDVPTTAASKILENYQAVYSSTVATKLQEAGAVILGKTNLDEFALGSSGETSYFGATKNPIDTTRVPGGSSSGSAAAVADDQCAFSLGSDTGGSIRLPASFCGLVGLKPTYGLVSRFGLLAMASSFDQIGPLTKNVVDAALVLSSIAGPDKYDSTTVDLTRDYTIGLENSIKGLKIGVPKEFFVKGMDETVEKMVLEAIDDLRDQGAEIVEISLPNTRYALSTYYILMPAELSSNLARFDGVRYGYRAEASNLEEMYLETRKNGFGDEVKRRIMLGTYVLSSGYSDQYYKRAQKLRSLIKADFDRVFEAVDVIATPTSPSFPFKLGEKFDDPLTMYLADIFTVSANVAGLPAISLPCRTSGTLPAGLQLIGRHYDEATILRVAYHYEQNIK